MSVPRIGLALGGGAARGLAHIVMLEAFDELGIKPYCMAGTSMGALVGAAFASGIPAREIREHAEAVLGNRMTAARRLFGERVRGVFDLVHFRAFGPVQLNGQRLTDVSLPFGVVERLEDTVIPFTVVATDFYGHREIVFSSGPLRTALAASIAIPGLIAAPLIDGRVAVDGGMVNPVPHDHVCRDTDITVAIDVTGAPMPGHRKYPSHAELAIGSFQILARQLVGLRNAVRPPTIYIEALSYNFRATDFLKVREILAAAAPAKERLKRELERVIE